MQTAAAPDTALNRKVLVVHTTAILQEKLLEVAMNLGKRLEAGLDLLWFCAPDITPPPLTDFKLQAARAGVNVTLIRGEGEGLWEIIKGYGHHHRPPLVAVMMREEGKETVLKEEVMARKTRCPVILVSPQKTQPFTHG